MQPKEFERFAMGLAKNCNKRNFRKLIHSNPSACYRSAISRLYYGILHRIKNWLAERGFPIKEREIGRIHLIVRKRLAEVDRVSALYLKLLHTLRKQADYDLNSDVGYKEWKTALFYAKLIKRRLGI